MADTKDKDGGKKQSDSRSSLRMDSSDNKSDNTTSSMKTRDSRERSSMDMPVLSRSTSKSESKSESQSSRSESRDRPSGGSTRSESRERVKSEYSSKSKDSSQSTSRSESREKSSKTKYETKYSSKTETPDKKLRYEHSSKSDGQEKKSKSSSSSSVTDTARDPEYKEPIKLKLVLSQIRSFSSISPGGDDSNSDTSCEDTSPPLDYEEGGKRRSKKKDGGSGKKKRSKDKSRKSKSQFVDPDPDTLPPPELELMETGETNVVTSDAETSLMTDPEPLTLPEEMDISTDSAPGTSGIYPDMEDEDQQSQEPVKICSLCACGKKSLLGQGELCRYEPTPGFNPFRRSSLKTSKKSSADAEDRGLDKGPKPLTSRRQRGPLKKDIFRSPRRGADDDMCEGFDELATVGFPEDTDMLTVFESTGHTWAHHCCAAWSEGVVQNKDCVLELVDKAVVSGLSKKCNYCTRFGATINCRYPRCNKIYHYPCASGGGCFQDIKSLSLLCPEHTDEAQRIAGEEAVCVVCNIVGNISEQLFCTSCGHHYHGNCLHPPVEVNPTVRAGWQCPDCKICQMCRQPGDDSKMLVCDMCDKGYHTFCLRPVMTTIPKNGWKCKNCRVCEDCGSRTPGSGRSSRWHLTYSVCDSCYQQRNKGLSCPLCGKAYRHFSQKAMVPCNLCKKLVHSECDDTIDSALLQLVKNEEPTEYQCTICRNRDPEYDMPDFPINMPAMIEDSSDSMLMQKAGTMDTDMADELGEDSSQHSSQFLINEDSLSSTDIDLNILEKMSPPYMFPGREGEVGLGRGKLVAMARKKMSIASKAKNRGMGPEKRKRPLTFGDKRRGPKPKLHNTIGMTASQKKSTETDDDDDDHPNTIILANKTDIFTFDQDVCKSCGSFGKGTEGRLIGCTQCGQCYHPYCANIKVTKIVIQKGWRCLDCTVCEGCGKPHDEGRLLLCDECDISYHTYCLDPPLDHVPKGTWKCKWCVVCIICSSKSPGFGCLWQRNYTHCGPCHSKISCPVCRMKYSEDELIIQCVQCDRWLHAHCDGLHNEDDAERAADFGYHCVFCRPRTGQPGPLPPLPPPPVIQEDIFLPFTFPPPPREPEPPRYYLLDGVMVTGMAKKQIEKTMMEAPKIKRNRRWGKKPEGWDEKKGEIEKKIEELVAERQHIQEPENSTPTLTRMLSIGSADDEDKDGDLKSPDEGDVDPVKRQSLEAEAIRRLEEEKKQKKKRNVTKIGVGGFIPKPRFKPRPKQPVPGEGGSVEGPKEGLPRPLEGEEMVGSMLEDDKPKKWHRKVGPGRRKSQLQENFPSYMQEAFFGSDILAKSREAPKEGLKSLDSDEEKSPTEHIKPLSEVPIKEESSIQISGSIQKQLADMPKPTETALPALLGSGGVHGEVPDGVPSEAAAHNISEADDDLQDGDLPFFDIDENFIKMIEDELEDVSGIHVGPELLGDEVASPPEPKQSKDPDTGNLELDDDKNVDLATISMLSGGLTHIDSKTVEDIFNGVLEGPDGRGDQPAQPQAQHQQPQPQPQPLTPGAQPPGLPHPSPHQPTLPGLQHSETGGFPGMPMSTPPHGGSLPGMQMKMAPSFPGFQPELDPQQQLGAPHQPPPHHQPPYNYLPSWPQAIPDDTGQQQDNSRRNMQKWESDEDLGPDATISPILYCNMEHPELKHQYPEWSERSKQIAKIWRKLTPDEKQPYLLKARKNRGTVKARNQPKISADMRRKKAEAMMQQPLPGMPMQPPEMFHSPEGKPGMQSPMHSSPGGMQSPMRPGAQMMPGTPEGQSPGHPSPGHGLPGFPGSQPDPYHHMPSTPRAADPYGIMPPTPRGPGQDPFSQIQAVRKPSDPYSQPPSTPRPGEHEPFRSPRQDPFSLSPGVVHATDPFAHSPGPPSRPQSMGTRPSPQHQPSWPGQETDPYERQPPTPQADPYAQPPSTPRPQGPSQLQGKQQQRLLQRQISEPPVPGSAGEDPYAFTATSDHFASMRTDPSITTAVDPFAQPPGTSQPGMSGFPRPPRPPMRQLSIPGGEAQMPNQFRPPPLPPHMLMRPPNAPGDPYSQQQPGPPRPRMEHPMHHPALRHPEPSALQQMFAVANRRQTPLSRMWPLPLVQSLQGGAGGSTEDHKKQVREFVQNKLQKEALFGDMGGPNFPGMRPQRPPGLVTPGSGHAPHPEMKHPMSETEKERLRRELQERIRQQAQILNYYPTDTKSGQVPQGVPGIPVSGAYGQQGPPASSAAAAYQQSQGQPGTPPSSITAAFQQSQGQPGGPPSSLPAAYQHPAGQAGTPPSSVAATYPQGPLAVPPSSAPGPVQGIAEAPTSSPASGDGNVPQKHILKKPADVKVEGRIPKQSVSSEEEKPDDADLMDFFGADGTFDILKYADPDLDLGSDNKTIFDDLVDDTKPQEGDKKQGAKEVDPAFPKTETKIEPESMTQGDEQVDQDKTGSVSEFQAKFLEFSQRKAASEKAAATATGVVKSEGDKKTETGVGHIAALLGRPPSVKSESGDGMEAHTPRTPGTPMTPTDPNMMRQPQYPPNVPSPHQSSLYGQQSPSGLPSPKVMMPSPKSQPSPRTPGDVQFGQQPSPFSQHSTHSPFSPSATTPTSAPQSPYAGPNVRTQSPFAMPGTSSSQQSVPLMNQGSPAPTVYSPSHTPPTAFPMQRSPRANIPQNSQFMAGQYGQPGYIPPRGLAPGQPPGPFNQPGMRQPVPGIRPPTSLPVSQQQPNPGQPPMSAADLASPGMRPMHPGMRLPYPGHPPTSPGKPGQVQGPPSGGMYPGMAGLRPGTPGQQPPPGFMAQQHMIRPPSSAAAPATSAATVTTAAALNRSSLLEDQPLLIQDLLEQEKLEQQKRQREQQAMLQRDRGIRPEGMIGPRPGAPGMVGIPPGMKPRMETPVRHPGQAPGIFAQPEMPPVMRPRLPGQLSPHTQGAQPFGMPQGGSMQQIQGGPMIPLKPPTPGESSPEAERQYEHQLMKQGEFLEMQVKFLETQIQKQKRTKKAINARNRQAKKNGLEMPPQDVMELERASQEQSMLQKQLEQMRKHNRQHQIAIQEYRSKQQERFSQQMAQGGQPPSSSQPIPGASPITSAMQPANPMQPPAPRIPGAQGTARLTASLRQEYDTYMQNRLRQMGQTVPPRMPGPRPPNMPPGGQQPRMAIGDNNPFSDTYQQREQILKVRETHGKAPVDKPDDTPETPVPHPMPQFADPRFPGPGEQPPRFPPGSIEGQAWMAQRFPFDPAGPRMPGPGGDPRFPGNPMQQGQAPPNFAPELTHPQPTDAVTNNEPKEKTKKRKKKKKPADSTQTAASQAPPGKPPPMAFKPQDETERRIMEILNSTANMQRGQSPATSTGTPATTSISQAPPTLSEAQNNLGSGQVEGRTSSPHLAQSVPQGPQPSPLGTQASPQGRQPSPLVQIQSPGIPPSKTPPSQGRLTPGQAAMSPAPSPGRPTSLPTPPTLQAAPNMQQPGNQSSTVRMPGGPPSLQAAPGHQPVGQSQGPRQQQPTQQVAPPNIPTATTLSAVTQPPFPQGVPGQHFSARGQPVSLPGQPGAPPFTGPPASLPLGHPGLRHPAYMRHMVPQQQQHPDMPPHMQQFAGFSRFESMPGHPMQRPPPLPHWVAPGTTAAGNSQRRSSPRPAMAGMGLGPRMSISGPGARPGGSPGNAPPPGQGLPSIQQLTRNEDLQSSGGHTEDATLPSQSSGISTNVTSQPSGISPSHLSHPSSVPASHVSISASTASVMSQVSGTLASASSKSSDIPPSSSSQVSNIPPSTLSFGPNTSQSSVSQDPGKQPSFPSNTQGISSNVLPSVTASSSIQASASKPPGMPPVVVSQSSDTYQSTSSQPQGETSSHVVQHHTGPIDNSKSASPLPQQTSLSHHQTKSISASPSSSPSPSQGLVANEGTISTSSKTVPSSQTSSPGVAVGDSPAVVPPTASVAVAVSAPNESKSETKPSSDSQAEGGSLQTGSHASENTAGKKDECTDGIHCGTPPPCTDGIHCGTPPPQGECTDGIHCGTPPPCTDGIHCGTPPPCTDGIHCGTPPPQGQCTDGIHCGTPPPCTDGIHCGTPPPQGQCTDGIHCGTPPPCTDGIHCGTPPPCTDGIHCGTPPPCTDGIHCGTPPPQSGCTDGIHCGTPPPCTDGIHCGTPPPCSDGIHCGTPPPQGECTDGIHCGTPPPQSECTDGIHCGTPTPCTDGIHCGTPPPQGECTDGIHCGTPPPQGECTDGIHCGTPPPCTDGIHCGTPPPQSECTDGIHCGTPTPCTDGIHCGTPPPQGECTDGIHCGTPPPGTDGIHCGTPPPCTDGIHCGTPPPQSGCADGIHCGTPPPCTDGIHCGTPPPQGGCSDGIHCGTPPPCTDGIHCGTPPPCTDGIHCGTPPPCTDGIHCGTPPPCTDGIHCGTPPPCTDGIHCGTPPPQGECTDGIHCGTPPPCTDGIHCGTPPPQGGCTDGIHCGTPPPCTDGIHCGTPPPCTDGIHCGTPPPQGECTDGKHCGTPPPTDTGGKQNTSPPQKGSGQPSSLGTRETREPLTIVTQSQDAPPPPLEPVMLSPQQIAVQADHRYINVTQPPTLKPTPVSHNVSSSATHTSSVSGLATTITPSPVTIQPSLGSAFVNPVSGKSPPNVKQELASDKTLQTPTSCVPPPLEDHSSATPLSSHTEQILPSAVKIEPGLPVNKSEDSKTVKTTDAVVLPVETQVQVKTETINAEDKLETTVIAPMTTVAHLSIEQQKIQAESVKHPVESLKSSEILGVSSIVPVTQSNIKVEPKQMEEFPRLTVTAASTATPSQTSAQAASQGSQIPMQLSVDTDAGTLTPQQTVPNSTPVSTQQAGLIPAVAQHLTTVPKPQHFDPLPKLSGEPQQRPMHPGQPGRFPFQGHMKSGRHPFYSGLPHDSQMNQHRHPGFARMAQAEMGPRFPGQQNVYDQQGAPRTYPPPQTSQAMQPAQSESHFARMPRHWPSGQPPRIAISSQDSRQPSPGQQSPMAHDTSPAITSQGPRFPLGSEHHQAPGQEPRSGHMPGFPGHGHEQRVPTPTQESKRHISGHDPRYELQDPRFSIPGQHVRHPGQPGQEQRYFVSTDPRHPFPGSAGFQQFLQQIPGQPPVSRFPQHSGPPGSLPQGHRPPYPGQPYQGEQISHRPPHETVPKSGVSTPPASTSQLGARPLDGVLTANTMAEQFSQHSLMTGSNGTPVSVTPTNSNASADGKVTPVLNKPQTPPVVRVPSQGSSKSTPQSPASSVHTPSPGQSSSQRSSPAQSQSPGHSTAVSTHEDMQLPSVSATFAAAGMHRLGEHVVPPTAGQPPYINQRQQTGGPTGPVSAGPSFSSVSSIVQAVSTVSFPAFAGQGSQGGSQQPPSGQPAVPTEISLPPSTAAKSNESVAVSVTGLSASTQTPVHVKQGSTTPSAAPQLPTSQIPAQGATIPATSSQAQMFAAASQSAAGPTLPISSHATRPSPLPSPQQQGLISVPGTQAPGGPRMYAARPGVPPNTTASHATRPRGARQQAPYGHHGQQSRFPLPSNLPPHLAGMLTGMRNPMPNRPMFPQQQERHPGMPTGPMRFPPGHPLSMGPGGPRPYPGPHPVTAEGVPISMTTSSGMQMSPTARLPGMMQHPGMPGMRHQGQMRPNAQGGPMGQHPMSQMHPSQVSPTGHRGAPHMHPSMHATTSSMHMMGPPGMPHMSLPHSPTEMLSPTQRHPGAPPSSGSMPTTPSPTPSSYPHGGIPPASPSAVPTSTPVGFPGNVPNRPRYPFHRMPDQRMPYDPRMQFDPNNVNMNIRPGLEMQQRPPGMNPRFPPGDFTVPGIQQNKSLGPEQASQFEEAMRRMMQGQAMSGTGATMTGPKSMTPPSPGTSDAGSSSSTPIPMSAIKQEPITVKHDHNDLDTTDLPLGMDAVAQNALLKKLLARSKAKSGIATPQSELSEDSNDFTNIQLTPAQQRQLDLIEKMPLTKEKAISDQSLLLDANDPDIEAKRQEFERRRKVMEDMRKTKRKNPDGTPRKRNKKKKGTPETQDNMAPQVPGQGQGQPGLIQQPLGPYDPQNILDKEPGLDQVPSLLSPDKEKKKRIRKPKKDKPPLAGAVPAAEGEVPKENMDSLFEMFSNQLKQLAPVPLMEPHVGHTYTICSVAGSAPVINGESCLAGLFGRAKMNKPDYYEDMLAGTLPLVETIGKDSADRRKLIIDGKPDTTGLTEEQQRFRLIENLHDGQRSSPPFGLGSLGMPRGVMPSLPPQPRVEPRIRIPKATDSPDSMISSSSPETGFGDNGDEDQPDYPMLRPIEPAVQDEEKRTSPTVPLLQPVPVKLPSFLIKQENQLELEQTSNAADLMSPQDVQIPTHKGKKELDSALSLLAGKENRHGDIDALTGLSRSSKDTSGDAEVSVTLTLSAKAAEDIGGVLSAIADLLKIAAPPTYEVSRSPSPEQFKSTLKHKEEALNIQSLSKSRFIFCSHCEAAVVNAGIRKKKTDIPALTKDELESEEEIMTFCSMNCYINFTVTRQVTQKPDITDGLGTLETSVLASSLAAPPIKDQGLLSPREITPTSSTTLTPAVTPSPGMGMESMETTPIKSGPPTPQLGSPTLMRQRSEFDKLGKRQYRRSSSITEQKPLVKKWKDVRYRRFDQNLFPEILVTIPQKKEEDEMEMWAKLTMSLTHDREKVKDSRMCEFCQEYGDGEYNGTSRLLNMDIDKWSHLNCALWSQEVYETLNGALMNVQQAYKRSIKQKCVVCVKTGASLVCFKSRCNNIYHVQCAQLVGCVFFEDKSILCPPHAKGQQLEQVLKSLVVYRKVYINRDEDTQVANMLLQEDHQHTLRLGSLILHSIGQLLPHQMAGGRFNNRDHMYPVGYKTTRLYWSMRTLYKRSRYICSIQESEGHPEFVITVMEEGLEDITLQHPSCSGVWKYVLEPLEKMHKEADLVKVFPTFTSGEELYGLTDPNIVRLIESLPGTDLLKDYVFKFGRRQLIDLPLTVNPTGCARSEPKLRTHFKKPHTLQSSSTHSLPSTVTSLTGDLNSPYMKHFVHSKSQQYRKLKQEWKNLVYLGRSRIQGLGLYAAKDLEMHTMVIEYIGDLIRNEVANHREKIYEAQNRGVYMFRIDNDTVVDATMAGGPARYINHSCDPNCVAEVVDIDKESKIIIITNRRIPKGEELAYDYQFDEEDEANKIPCSCGAWNCRKWMN